ncbi:uncharacterized protein LOC110729189 [Chenopodium quinoa]|uniref:uncharacterized protein LOC110729189 n=1 Tax=Chenopodium quinoa TaxID=63459 RepID=UPI000B781415|nr:uncharacterized protein LOC110729189 [Chenopodium quinoa]
MYCMKVAAAFYMWSSVMILLGFLAQFTSYSKDGHTVIMFGYALLMVVCLWLLKINAKAPCYKELRVYEWAAFVCVVFGSIPSCLGTINIEGPNRFVWVGVGAGGSLVMFVGGAVLLAKEIRIEQLEGKILPVNEGEL